jgi:hypothetical protein
MLPKKPINKSNKTKRNKFFSDQSRLRADARMASRALTTLQASKNSESTAVMPGNVFLTRNLKRRFGFKIENAKREYKKSRNIFSTMREFLRKSNVFGHYESTGHFGDDFRPIGKVRITKKKGRYYKNRKGYRSSLFHEVFHSMQMGSGETFANAIDTYMENSEKRRRSLKQVSSDAKKLSAATQKLKQLEINEYDSSTIGVSPHQIGGALGYIARELERISGKNGQGLFFLRDVEKGKNAEQAIGKLLNGGYEAELKNWLKLNPRMKRII